MFSHDAAHIISEIPELTYKGMVAIVLVLHVCPSSSPDHTQSHQGWGVAFKQPH